MNKNKEVDEFLGGLEGDTDQQDPLNPQETDPFSNEPTDVVETKESKEGEEEDKTDTKPEPFHKDPKVQRYVQRQIDEALQKFKAPVTEAEKFAKDVSEDEDEFDEVLTRMIGNDTPEKIAVSKDFKKLLRTIEERGAKKAMSEFRAEQQKIVEEDAKAQKALTQGFEAIEEEYNVDLTSNTPLAKKTRNDFIDFVKRIAPKNASGQVTEFPDFSEAFSVFQDTKKAETSKTTNRAKELANRGMQRSTTTSSDVKPKDNSWNAVDRLFSKLG